MKIKYWCSIAATAILVLCSNILFAWSANGHKIVAQIAWSQLQKDAATNPLGPGKQAINRIQPILDSFGSGTTLSDIAICADEIRILKPNHSPNGACAQFPIMPQSAPWHFIDIPITDTPQKARDLKKYCLRHHCVLDQVRVNLKTLQKSSDLKTQQLALMFLVHFVGDLHQPLHCATEVSNGTSDRGGNEKTVKLILPDQHHTLNLHSLWDHLIQPSDNNNDPVTFSQRIEANIPKDTSTWIVDNFVTNAVLESFNFSKINIYPDFYGNGPDGTVCQGSSLDAGYQNVMGSIVDQRLELAGVRLAELLKQAFSNQRVTMTTS